MNRPRQRNRADEGYRFRGNMGSKPRNFPKSGKGEKYGRNERLGAKLLDLEFWPGLLLWNSGLGPKSRTDTGPPREGKGSFCRCESRNPGGKYLRTDPGGKVYQDIDWALKTIGGSLDNNMPLLSEFSRYGNGESQRKDGRRCYITAQ